MYNRNQWNRRLWNRNTAASAAALTTDLVAFDQYSLSDLTNIICTKLIESAPKRDILSGNVPRADGQYYTADYYRNNVITVEGLLKAATPAAMQTLIDTFKKTLRTTQGNLDIVYNEDASTRKRYIATLENYNELLTSREHYHVTIVPFVAKFLCLTPFASDIDYSSTAVAFTVSPTNKTATNAGTIEAEPVLIVIFDAASSVTEITITNVTTGEVITVTTSFSTNDVLKIDGENKAVTLNGADVDFSGAFPSMDVGSNNFKFEITGSSFTASATIKWKNRYL